MKGMVIIMKIKKNIVVLLIVLITTGLFTGCGNSEEGLIPDGRYVKDGLIIVVEGSNLSLTISALNVSGDYTYEILSDGTINLTFLSGGTLNIINTLMYVDGKLYMNGSDIEFLNVD